MNSLAKSSVFLITSFATICSFARSNHNNENKTLQEEPASAQTVADTAKPTKAGGLFYVVEHEKGKFALKEIRKDKGLEWYLPSPASMTTWREAKEICAKQAGMRLPTIEELVEARKAGLGEVGPFSSLNHQGAECCWSSTLIRPEQGASQGVKVLSFVKGKDVPGSRERSYVPDNESSPEPQSDTSPMSFLCVRGPQAQTTKSGAIFDQIGRDKNGIIYKDVRDDGKGLEWHVSAGTFFWKFAKDECQKRGLRLPTKGEFEDAEKRGIREILKLDRKDSMAWSSTLVNESGDSSNGIVTFDFNNGQLESTSDYNFKANLVCVKN